MFAFDEPFGSSIFCDDIRHEIGGKLSLIGVYQAGIFLPSFPATLPKFAISISLFEPKAMSEARDWPIPLKVFLPGSESEAAFTAELPPEKDVKGFIFEDKDLPKDQDVPEMFQMRLQMVMAPLNIQTFGRIKVRADYKGKQLKLGSIGVSKAKPSDSSAAISLLS